MFSGCSDCCPNPEEGKVELKDGYEIQAENRRTSIGNPDRNRAKEISSQTDRHWVSVAAYQPVDTITRTVEVPVVKTVETFVPKITVEEKIIEVPRYIPESIEKIVEVPEIKIVDEVKEVPQYHYNYKYVPKIENKENIIQRPKIEIKYIEKIVEVPQIKEVVRYQDVETIEEVIRYVPKGQKAFGKEVSVTKTGDTLENNPLKTVIHQGPYITPSTVEQPQYIKDMQNAANPLIPQRMEQVFKPKVVKSVEIQKHVPISVDVPVPYMVPKPMLVPVQVPVLKFRDHFVPVPVRRVVVPRIRWTNEVYEVECIKEKPFLQVQDIIKPVPCDVEINVHEFVDKAQPINPAELSQADIHAMWMRVNADLAEKKKEELGENFAATGGEIAEEGELSKEAPGLDQDPSAARSGLDPLAGGEAAENEEAISKAGELGTNEGELEPLSLHPGHPLSMTYLQNQWIKRDTTSTHQMYTPEWFQAHQQALYQMKMQNPSQVQLTAEQAAIFQPEQQPFGETPWSTMYNQNMPEFSQSAASHASLATSKKKEANDRNCPKSACCGGEPNPDAACCF